MSGQLTLFTNLTKVTDSYITLGDGTTKIHVSGKGTIKINIETFVIELHNVLLVPDLEDTLFSITEHIQSPNCSLRVEKNKYTLFYPTFNIIARLDNEVHLQISPCTDINRMVDFSTLSNANSSSDNKILRTTYKVSYVEQESIIIIIMIFIFIITINQYLNHQMYATTKRVSLPINNPFESK